jgi:hypothetical protein
MRVWAIGWGASIGVGKARKQATSFIQQPFRRFMTRVDIKQKAIDAPPGGKAEAGEKSDSTGRVNCWVGIEDNESQS